MGRKALWVALTAVVLLAAVPSAQAASRRDVVVSSFDGTPIVAHFFANGGRRAPTVLRGHGYGFQGDTSETESDEIFGGVGVAPLLRAGYNVLTWDARGFGGSGGQVEIDSAQFEGRDVQALLDFVARQPEAQLDRPGDPRAGMIGPSYGGAIQLVSAGIDRRVDAIVPIIAWHSLVRSLYRESSVKQGWGLLLTGVGGTALTNGIISPAGIQTGSLNPQVPQAAAEGVATGRFSEASVRFFAARNLQRLVAGIRAPTLLVQGQQDTLFTPKEAMDSHEVLTRSGVPVRMMWFCGGHGICLDEKGPGGHIERAAVRWFGRYLSRRRSVEVGPAFEWITEGGAWRRAAQFPLPRKGLLRTTGAGTLALTAGSNATAGGGFIAALPSPDAVNVPLPAPRSSIDAIGEPRLRLTYSGVAAPADTHAYAQIVDVPSGRVVDNQVAPIPLVLDGRQRTVERLIEPIAAGLHSFSNLRLQVAPASNVYGAQRSSGLVRLLRIELTLPTVDTRAGPSLRLGRRTRGMRRARRGRPFRIAVHARGARLRRARIVVRNRRGRAVGRSRRFTLRGRVKVRVRVRRRLARGRYSIRAEGFTTLDDRLFVKRGAKLRRR